MIKCQNPCPEEKYDGCCFECPYIDECEDDCGEVPSECGQAIVEGTELEVFQKSQLDVLNKISTILTEKKRLEAQEKELKEKLKEAMEKYNVKKFESDILNITYVAETTTTSIDSKKLKQKYPEIAEECSKTTKKSAYVRVAIK